MTEEKDDLFFIKNQKVKDILNSSLEYKDLIVEVFERLKRRKFLDIKNVKKLLEDMETVSIDVDDFRGTDTDLKKFQSAIAQLDANRALLSDLLSEAQNDYDALESYYKDLREIWINKSNAKSSDKREGEASEILFFFTNERIVRKETLNSIKTKFNLMTMQIEAISREITIGLELRKNLS